MIYKAPGSVRIILVDGQYCQNPKGAKRLAIEPKWIKYRERSDRMVQEARVPSLGRCARGTVTKRPALGLHPQSRLVYY